MSFRNEIFCNDETGKNKKEREQRRIKSHLSVTIKSILNNIPDVLMLHDNRIEFNGSLLQFKNKTSFVLRNCIFDSPTDFIQKLNII